MSQLHTGNQYKTHFMLWLLCVTIMSNAPWRHSYTIETQLDWRFTVSWISQISFWVLVTEALFQIFTSSAIINCLRRQGKSKENNTVWRSIAHQTCCTIASPSSTEAKHFALNVLSHTISKSDAMSTSDVIPLWHSPRTVQLQCSSQPVLSITLTT